MADEKLGIKEVREVQLALNEVVIFLAERAKDGLAADDAIAVVDKMLNDADFKAKVAAAVENIAAVPAEVSDLDIAEAMELVTVQLPFIPRLLAAFKK